LTGFGSQRLIASIQQCTVTLPSAQQFRKEFLRLAQGGKHGLAASIEEAARSGTFEP
jgi:hypothetical protein